MFVERLPTRVPSDSSLLGPAVVEVDVAVVNPAASVVAVVDVSSRSCPDS
jgi:hypothetical protein